MNKKTFLQIQKNKKKLEKMINEKAPYEKILKQSQILDKYILKHMLENNKEKEDK